MLDILEPGDAWPHHSFGESAYGPTKNGLTDPRNLLSQAPQGFRPKKVVHSRHWIVIRLSGDHGQAFITFLFHGQAIDFVWINGFGVFLANLAPELAASLQKRGAMV